MFMKFIIFITKLIAAPAVVIGELKVKFFFWIVNEIVDTILFISFIKSWLSSFYSWIVQILKEFFK